MMTVAEITERLDRLQEHGFITGWDQSATRRLWVIHCGVTWGPYSQGRVSAWIEGANAMGAAP